MNARATTCRLAWKDGPRVFSDYMNSARPWRVSVIMAAILAASVGLSSRGEAAGPLTADEVIKRMVERAQQAEDGTPKTDYTYTRLTVTEELDASGNVKERKEKAHQVYCRHGVTSTKPITVNGLPHQLEIAAHETLLHVIRDRLNLSGTKLSCGRGECGACTVLLSDGSAPRRPVSAWLCRRTATPNVLETSCCKLHPSRGCPDSLAGCRDRWRSQRSPQVEIRKE